MIITEGIITAAAFTLLVILLGKPLFKVGRKMLHNYREVINSALDSSAALRERAKGFLTQFSLSRGKTEAEEKIKVAKKVAEHTLESALSEIDKMMQEKLDYAMYKLAQNNALVMQELREISTYIASDAIRKYVEENASDNATQREILAVMSADFRKKLH